MSALTGAYLRALHSPVRDLQQVIIESSRVIQFAHTHVQAAAVAVEPAEAAAAGCAKDVREESGVELKCWRGKGGNERSQLAF